MKKIVYILFLGLILSCNSNKKLEGNWIGAYSYSGNVDSSWNSPILSFVTFKNNEYFIKKFKFEYQYRSDNDFEKGTYEYKRNKLTHNSDINNYTIIESINNDSLIVKGQNGANNSVFKKLNDSLKNKTENIKLVGKTFLSKSVKNKELNKVAYDTISFINDSLFIWKSDKRRNPETHWERFEQNGFDIIFMEMGIPLIITKGIKNKVYITGLHEKTYYIELTEIK